ncbi:MAG: hypothetical protein R2720_08650 [Candidatus Nanopelagicales bacterium]
MRAIGILGAALIWILCWLIAPASWWLNARLLDEQAFADSMTQVLQIEDVDSEITTRATARVMTDARDFVQRNAPLVSDQVDFLLDRAEPTVADVVSKAVNSQPGEKAMLATAVETHNVLLAWLDQDTLGRPGLQADLDTGHATLDLDQMLAGQAVTLGPVRIPLDALDVPGIAVPVPLPPDWMRTPINLLRWAFIPALIGIGGSGIALVLLSSARLRVLAVVSALTAVVCGGAAALISSAWALSGADSADWTLTRAISALLVRPWITAYLWIVVAMVVITLGALSWDRFRLVRSTGRA